MFPNLLDDASHRPARIGAVAVAVALLVVSAGCVGAAGALPFTEPAPYTQSGAALDGADLRTAHLAGLEQAGSFTSTSTIVVDGEEHAFQVERTASVDAAANRSTGTSRFGSDAVDGDGLVVTRFTSESTTSRRVQVDAGQQTITRYDAANAPYDEGLLAVQPVNETRATNADLVRRAVDDVNWTMVGVERYQGQWVTRYEAAGPENVTAMGSTAVAEGHADATDRTTLPETLDLDVQTANATLLVTPDGVVRRFSVDATGNAAGHPVEVRITSTTDDVGQTTVATPDWTDEATGGRSA